MKKALTISVAAVAAAGLAAAPLAGVTSAFADNPANVTITENGAHENVTYAAYKLFTADAATGNTVNDATDTDKQWHTVTNVEFATGAEAVITKAVEKYLAIEGVAASAATDWAGCTVDGHLNAQKVAEYLAKYITASKTVAPASNSLGSLIAHVAKDGAPAVPGVGTEGDEGYVAPQPAVTALTAAKTGIATNTKTDLVDSGYYLFVADSFPSDTFTAGSGVLYAAVGGDDVTITEKLSTPTVDKKVENAEVFDASMHEDINYSLTATVPATIADYTTYAMNFKDTLSKGLTLVKAGTDLADTDFTVKIMNGVTTVKTLTADEYDVTSAAATGDATLYTIAIPDIKAAGATAGMTVVVTYKAQLNENAVIGTTGNANDVTLEYSNDPYSEQMGTTTSDEVRTYTFGLDIKKVDKATNEAMNGVKFTITNADGDYIAPDGDTFQVIAKAAGEDGEGNPLDTVKWTTSNGGMLTVVGVDAGTYTITETDAPSEYTKAAPFTVTIAPEYEEAALAEGEAADPNKTYDDNGVIELVDLDASTHSYTATDTQVFEGIEGIAGGAFVNNAAGKVETTVKDIKGINLPITGEQGFMLMALAGGIVIVVSLGGMVVRRRNSSDSYAE